MKPMLKVTGQRGTAIIFKRTYAAIASVAHDMSKLPEYEVTSKTVSDARGMFVRRVDAVKHAMDAVGGPCELEEM